MSLSRRQLMMIGGSIAVILIIVLIFIFGSRRQEPARLSGNLEFWGVFGEPAVMNEIIAAYRKDRPKMEINYTQLNSAAYESDLINALATAKGPDLFMFQSSWLPKHYDKIQPLTESQLPLVNFRRLFPTVVEQNFAPDGVIYALPLYIDTLAMFYNKDIFDAKGVALPPKPGLELQNLIPKIRELDKTGKIIKAAAAIGGSDKSVNRAADILNLLMLQSGVPMVNQDFTQANFGQDGLATLKFYTQFANPGGQYYTWNENFPYSVDSFAEGQTAVMFNYSHQIAALTDKNPFLNFTVAPMPQPNDAETVINWANYWGLAVSAQSRQSAAAWDFISWLTTDEQASTKYLQLTGRPPALRSLIPDYKTNPELGVFAEQALTARSWPQIDSLVVENAFSKMIADVINGKSSADKAIRQTEEEISQLMRKRIQ